MTSNQNTFSISRFCSALIFLTFLAMSPTLGQTDYSDSWLDTTDPNNIYIVGAGVTDNDYSGDAIGVETTVTSPNGRTITDGSTGDTSARVEVALLFDWNDLGDYFVESRHQPLCSGNWDGSMIYETRYGGTTTWHYNPDYFRCAERRLTSFVQNVALKKTAFVFLADDTVNCYYNSTCLGVCNPRGTSWIIATKLYPGRCPQPYIQCRELYAGGRCFKDTRACTELFQEGTCDQ